MQDTPTAGAARKFAAALRTFLTAPLRKILSYSLEHPELLQFATRTVSHFPTLFNWLLKFAQRHGIVMDEEYADPGLEELQAVADLSPEARNLFESLQRAFNDGAGTAKGP